MADIATKFICKCGWVGSVYDIEKNLRSYPFDYYDRYWHNHYRDWIKCPGCKRNLCRLVGIFKVLRFFEAAEEVSNTDVKEAPNYSI